ncbi:MAG: bifunctional riboflavin kinase/FAD synthetase [Chloroflexi bacterium]|nr:bifunctional riboflavin kinase/FAD synthetase [Chloroflexota bacterium]
MQIHDSLEQVTIAEPSVLTIGKFNGMHHGHHHLLAQVVARARALGGRGVALTFDPHPTLVLQPQHERVYLAPEDERRQLLAASGIDDLIVLAFDKELMSLTAEQFMARICERVNLRELWVGPDFRLGYRAQGTIEVLVAIGQRLGYSVHPIAPLVIDGSAASATRVRELLHAGQVADVPQLLGRPFMIAGTVVRGDQRGRTIGFPTANIAVGGHDVLPADGVYACRVILPDGSVHNAVTNVGVRPTFGVLNRTVEAHLLDWSGDLYDQRLRVMFLERLRGEQKFSGIDELKAQIARDADRAREVLASC